MADVISRLRLESGEFDSKIKRAGQELLAYAEHCKKTGLQMGYANKDAKDFAAQLGKMTTTATTARGKVGELSDAFVNLKSMYNQMTDAEKKGQFGKSLAASLDQLKVRIINAKKELSDINKELSVGGGTGGLFGGGKIDGMLQVFGGNLMTKAAGWAVGFAGEMADMVKQGIQLAKAGEGVRIAFERLGRGDILQGLREATHGTVTDLELMKAAVKFNDFKLPVEELGTMLAFAQQKAKDTGQSVDYMVDSIVTGLGRKSLMILDNLGLSATEVKEKMKETGDMTKAVGEIIREQMSKAGDYMETAADRAAQANVTLQNKMEELGRKFAPVEEASNQLWTSMKIGILDIVGGPLARLLNGLTEAGRMKNALNDMNGDGSNGNPTKIEQQLKKLQLIKSKVGGEGYYFKATSQGMIEDYNRQIMAIDKKQKELQTKAGDSNDSSGFMALRYEGQIKDLDTQKNAIAVMRDQLAAGIRDMLKPVSQNATSNTPTTTTGRSRGRSSQPSYMEGSISEQQALVSDLNKKWQDAAGTVKNDYLTQLVAAESVLAKMKESDALDKWEAGYQMRKGGINIDMSSITGADNTALSSWFSQVKDQQFMGLTKEGQKALSNQQKQYEKQQKKKGEDKSFVDVADQMVGGINNMVGSLEQMGIELPEGFKGVINGISGVIGVLNSIVMIVNAIQAMQEVGTFLGIFANGGIVPKFADGGMIGKAALGIAIPGNSMSGDNLRLPVDGGRGFIGVNSGEVILNRAQMGVLASALEGSGAQGMQLSATIRGEDIRLSINNNGRRTGRGEFVQSTRRR